MDTPINEIDIKSGGYGNINGNTNGHSIVKIHETRLGFPIGSADTKFETHALKETTSLSVVRAKQELSVKVADSILVGTPTYRQ